MAYSGHLGPHSLYGAVFTDHDLGQGHDWGVNSPGVLRLQIPMALCVKFLPIWQMAPNTGENP